MILKPTPTINVYARVALNGIITSKNTQISSNLTKQTSPNGPNLPIYS